MTRINEALVEGVLLEQLQSLGYTYVSDTIIGPDGAAPERASYADVILQGRLEQAITHLNPHIPAEARSDALKKVLASERPNLIEENRRLHKALVEGVEVEFYADDGTIRGDRVRLVDFDQPDANDWLVSDQFTIIEHGVNRRPDVVVFVNGLPVAVFELKNPGDEGATLTGAYNQLQTYKAQISSLFRTNAVLVIADGLSARIGSLTSDFERFMPWRTVDGSEISHKGQLELDVLTAGVFEHRRFLTLLRDFIVFGDTGSGLTKIVAGYHQFHAVLHAVGRTVTASSPEGDRRIGVIWHTQGSGKSLLMAFYAGQLVKRPELENPTLVVLTDRNDLDDQLFSTFSMCADLIRQTPVQAESREDLQGILNRASGGVVFTTIQKFAPPTGQTDYPVLTERRNVVVIADEAHRSQYGFSAKVNRETGEMAYGFAKYMRDALPNASFVGFTGTPIEQGDVNTPAVFGDYIDVYDISRAVEDGATVPILYESRLARIELSEDERPKIDAEVEALLEGTVTEDQERIKRRGANVEALVGSEKRLKLIAADLVAHYEARVAGMQGKAMVVCMSRRICVALYNELKALRPEWHSDDDTAGVMKVVMTGSASDDPSWQPHIGNRSRRDLIAKRAKDPDDPLGLVLVRDMWLTGFDAPSMHTMYIDKPMRGHGLMQAIARVNRVFRDKPGGLVVDYIGIAQNLKQALAQYSNADKTQVGIPEEETVALLLEKLDVVRGMLHGFDYRAGLTGTPHERLVALAGALDWVLGGQHQAALKETDDDAKRRAHRRYPDSVLALTKAFALAAATDEAREVRDEVGFLQTVRAAMIKAESSDGRSDAERAFAVQQLVNGAVASTEIVDILAAAGLETPDISILSNEFLADMQGLDKKNLALEALRKLLGDEIRSRSQSNVTESKRFSERLSSAVLRYHTNAITTAEVIQELIRLAKEIRESRARGDEQGLSADEIAFYDALAENASAVEVMGNDLLKVIAADLLKSLKSGITVDWAHRESARARLRVLVKRILRKHGYPPDLQNEAVKTVLRQAEALSAAWAV